MSHIEQLQKMVSFLLIPISKDKHDIGAAGVINLKKKSPLEVVCKLQIPNIAETEEISFDCYTVCPRSSDSFYIVRYYIKWVTTSWGHSTNNKEILYIGAVTIDNFNQDPLSVA